MPSTLNPACLMACTSGTSRSPTCTSGKTTTSASSAHRTVTMIPAAPTQPRPGLTVYLTDRTWRPRHRGP